MKKEKSKDKSKVKIEYKGNKGIDRVANRRELADQDYINQLTHKEREWLERFNAEYIGGTFKKNPDDSYSKKNLHKTAELRRDCYSRNNARNRCELTKAKATGHLLDVSVWEYLENLRVSNPEEAEDNAITLIDIKDNPVDERED